MEYCGGGSLQDIYHGTVNLMFYFKPDFAFHDCCLTQKFTALPSSVPESCLKRIPVAFVFGY